MRTRHWSSLALLLLQLLWFPLSSCNRNVTTAGPTTIQAEQSVAEPPVRLPNDADSFKFAVLGDFGTGERLQYELAEQMAAFRDHFKYEAVVLVGDNLYGAERPQDFKKKFEVPYKPLLDSGVKFYV